jgi:Uncharacterized conserved protein
VDLANSGTAVLYSIPAPFTRAEFFDFDLDGDLTIRGITKPVTLDAEFAGAGVTGQGTPMLGFSAKTSIDREAFDITWNAALETGGLGLGKKVEIQIDVELLKAE